MEDYLKVRLLTMPFEKYMSRVNVLSNFLFVATKETGFLPLADVRRIVFKYIHDLCQF
jgi:hypothetical protein